MSLSRKFARESQRGKKLMEQYQPTGAYKEAEKRYKEELLVKGDAKRNSNSK